MDKDAAAWESHESRRRSRPTVPEPARYLARLVDVESSFLVSMEDIIYPHQALGEEYLGGGQETMNLVKLRIRL